MSKHKKSHRRINGVFNNMYTAQVRRPYGVTYSREEFREWLFSQQNFKHLYNKWVESGYKKNIKPSVDRIDDYKPYSFDNIQLITWGENFKKWTSNPTKTRRPIIKYDKNNNKIEEYISMSEASRKIGISMTCLSDCCNGKQKTSRGFIWKFKH